MEARANRSHRTAENVGGFFVAKFLKLTEHHRFAVIGGEAEHGLAHALNIFAAHQVRRRHRWQGVIVSIILTGLQVQPRPVV